MSDLTEQYSGVVINQNVVPGSGDKLAFSANAQWYQEFFLPSAHPRGSVDTEQIIPPLTGFHLLTEVAADREEITAIEWTLERQVIGTGWVVEGSGTSIGAPVSGSKVWFECKSDSPIDITSSTFDDRFRIGFKYWANAAPVINQEVTYENNVATINSTQVDAVIVPGEPYLVTVAGTRGFLYQDAPGEIVYYSDLVCPTSIWYSTPNPLALTFSTARGADGTTAITTGGGASLSFCFRVMGLVADSGTDFLGNTYRSAVAVYNVDNTNTTDGDAADRIWMSKPNPSRFAVENLYYDIRQKRPQTYGPANLIKNPNGESGAGFWFDSQTNAAATSSSSWSAGGSKSIRVTGTTTSGTTYPGLAYQGSTPTNWARVRGGQKHSFSAKYNIVSLPASATNHYVVIRYADVTGTVLTGQDTNIITPAATSTGVKTVSLTGFTSPGSAYYASVMIYVQCSTASQTYDFLLDQVLLTESETLPPYFDGNSTGYDWEGTPNLSISLPTPTPTVDDTAVVIDKVLVDPVTPGVFFSVYYSNEGVAGTNEAEWENKLWTRVPGTFQATKRDSHALPSPITTKFVKIEFSHLQAKSYDPGDLAKPATYKKHPKWVLEYFMARVNSKNSLEARMMNKSVGVIFDGYDLAYNYYLDDLKQEPDQPIETIASSSVVDEFIKDDSFLDEVDPTTAQQIKVAFTPYAKHVTGFFGQGLLPDITSIEARNTDNTIGNYPSEYDPGSSYSTSSLRSADVAFENDFPVMFFFVTCRHKYREITAPFSHNRAYFVGIRQISFSRENYTARFDTDHYIEPAGDLLNIERNDFITVDGVMTTN